MRLLKFALFFWNPLDRTIVDFTPCFAGDSVLLPFLCLLHLKQLFRHPSLLQKVLDALQEKI